MERSKLKQALYIFSAGFLGIISTIFMKPILPEEILYRLLEQFSIIQIKLLLIINPTVLLIIAVLIGTLLFDKVGLKIIIANDINNYSFKFRPFLFVKECFEWSILIAFSVTLFTMIIYPHLSQEFIELSEKTNPNYFVRILYGGITEEVLIRYGLMTFIAWFLLKIVKAKNTAFIFWTSIVLSSLVFAFGHLPTIYFLLKEIDIMVLSYIVTGNLFGGLVFGYLYWKKGFEYSIGTHILTNLILIIPETILLFNR